MRYLIPFIFFALPLAAQKPRLELADSAAAARASAPGMVSPPARAAAVPEAAGTVRRIANTPFVQRQTMLGIALYGPSFALTATRETVPGLAAWLVMAGGTFVAATEFSRHQAITDAMQHLASVAPIIGGAVGGALQYAATGRHDLAPGIFFGSMLGTTGALTLGRRLSVGAARASTFGAIATAGVLGSAMQAFDSSAGGGRRLAAVSAAGAVAGLQLGAMYGTYARYTVTPGDVMALGVAGAIGAAAAGSMITNGSPDARTTTLALLGGWAAGTYAGDRLLVRRFDHTEAEGRLVGVAGVAGALMGVGIATIAGADGRMDAATALAAAAGAAGGVAMAEHWMGVRPDAARRLGGRVTVMPQGLALAALHQPGIYSLVSVSF